MEILLLLKTPSVARLGLLCPSFFGAMSVFSPLECRLRAADCQRMALQAPNPRIRATLTDMARTWTRLALEAEVSLKESRPALRLIDHDPPSPPAART